MTTKNIFKIAVMALLTSSTLLACSSKDNEPVPTPPTEETLVVSDLRVDLEFTASSEVDCFLIATKGFEPNIYRDGKIVSQGNYSSEPIITQSLKTSLSHQGRALVCGLILDRPSGDETDTPITVQTTARLYKNAKLIQEYSNSKTITTNSVKEEFHLWGKP